jgi:hypothetical protein
VNPYSHLYGHLQSTTCTTATRRKCASNPALIAENKGLARQSATSRNNVDRHSHFNPFIILYLHASTPRLAKNLRKSESTFTFSKEDAARGPHLYTQQ